MNRPKPTSTLLQSAALRSSNAAKMALALLLVVLGTGAPVSAFTPTENGLYAAIDVTIGATGETGTLGARLFFQEAPLTVANFVALAEGTVDWLDLQGPAPVVRSGVPFFDGLTFHRIISGFVVQGGSPNGQGTDGPGYRLWDEIDPALSHNRAGLLSMANSGPDTGGSQFFITLAATLNLNGKHAVFGELVADSLPLLQRMGSTPTGPGDRPTSPVTMTAIRILRIGAAAEAFRPNQWALPRVAQAVGFTLDDQSAGTGVVPRDLIQAFPRPAGRDHLFLISDQLETWRTLFYQPSAAQADPDWTLNIAPGLTGSPQFLQVWEIAQPETPQAGLTLNLVATDGTLIVLRLTDPGTGNYTITIPGGDLVGAINPYRWVWESATQARTQLFLDGINVPRFFLRLDFGNQTFRLFARSNPPANAAAATQLTFNGTFTTTGLPSFPALTLPSD